MVNIEYQNAYAEVLDILNFIPEEDYKRIPTSKIKFFKLNANKNYKQVFNPEKTLDEQGISKKAKVIIALLFRDYWATDKQREKIIKKQKNDRLFIEKEKKKKYADVKEIFSQKHINQENTKMVVYRKENLIQKCIKRLKKFFNIN